MCFSVKDSRLEVVGVMGCGGGVLIVTAVLGRCSGDYGHDRVVLMDYSCGEWVILCCDCDRA